MTDSLFSFLLQLVYLFKHMTIADMLDVALVALVFFVAFQALYRTRALQMLRGVIIIAILGGTLFFLLPFNTLNWLVKFSLLAGVIALPLLFQDELRRVVTGLGQIGHRRGYLSGFERCRDVIIKAVRQLAVQRVGALIILEGQTPLEDIIATGIPIQAKTLTTELLQTIFHPKTALHDGAIVIREDRLVAASCILPVQIESTGEKHLGTRHRAALGLTRKIPDAMVIVVSEETSFISVAWGGQLFVDLTTEQLEGWFERFSEQFLGNGQSRWRWIRGGGLVSTLVNLVVAIGLALVAWLSVSYQMNPPTQAIIKDVPLIVSGLSENLVLMSELPETVRVQVRTMQDRLALLDNSSVRAELSLADLPAGVHQVTVHATTADTFTQVVSVTPRSSNVILEPSLSIILTPTVTIMDLSDLPPSYVLREVKLTPDVVTVSGSKSQVEKIKEARVSLALGNHRADFQETLLPVFLDGQGLILEGLQSVPNQLLSTVQIGRTYFTRVVAVQSTLQESTLDVDYEITRIAIDPPTVTLVGTSSALEKAGDFLVTAPISLTNVYSEISTRAPLIIPDGLSALNEKSENVNDVGVVISVAPKTAYLVFTTKVNVINLPADLRAKVETSQVSVLLIGPEPLLAEIQKNPDLIKVSMDLRGFAVGVYTIPTQIQTPQGVRAQIFPSEIQVIIQ